MKKKYCILFLVLLLLQNSSAQSPRSVIDFNNDWKFFLGNDSNAFRINYNDAAWRKLSLPHDWSIESDFSKDAPATNQGGSLPGGIGWYRKSFTVPASSKNKNVSIEFDGVYKNSEVWINGRYLGKRPYGYSSFSYDVTAHLFFNKPNVLAVKVDNSQQPDSRWYTGSGIYRDVKLVSYGNIFIEEHGIFITTKNINGQKATLELTVSLNTKHKVDQPIKILVSVIDNKGRIVKQSEPVSMDLYFDGGTLVKKIILDNPVLWSVKNPALYKVKVQIEKDKRIVDEVVTNFGIRSFNFDADKGFFLNGELMKLYGVCMHHDLGALGTAFNKTAAKRQLNILKEMGCNAIRFSHNPPASAVLDLCDEMGFLVIDEAFDMWKKKKNKFDYHKDFAEWHKNDLEAMVYRDRNHPSIIAWSIGNEIREQFDSTGNSITKELVAIVKQIDVSRPVTTALTETMPEKNFITRANSLDLLGFNYKYYDYAVLPDRFPGQKFIATETASALSTRGVYEFPSDSMRVWPPDYKAQDTFKGNKDFTASAYDNTYAYWGGTHEKTWQAVKKYPHMAGIFVWSGFDFLGEPLPYPAFPARSSYYGIIDLAGFPKDVYYMYQSEWTNKPVLHLFPHWNWSKGDMVDIWTYYNNADEVELFVNNRSVGKRSKTDSTLHVMWRVPFEPGVLKAISRKNGKTVLIKEIKTAGKPAKIELMADRKAIRAGGKDMCFITARIVDAAGNTVPGANNLIQFSISGNAKITGTDNGYQADTVSLTSHNRQAWKGMALVMVRSSVKKGNSTLTARSPGLVPATIALKIAD